MHSFMAARHGAAASGQSAASDISGTLSEWATAQALDYIAPHELLLCAINKCGGTSAHRLAQALRNSSFACEAATDNDHGGVWVQHAGIPGCRENYVVSRTRNNGSTPMSHASNRACADSWLAHISSKRAISVAFVRDPVTRLLSAYLDKIYAERRAHKLLSRLPTFFSHNRTIPTFGEVISLLTNVRDEEMDPHFRPQSAFCGLRHVSNHYRLVRFEHFRDDLVQGVLPAVVERLRADGARVDKAHIERCAVDSFALTSKHHRNTTSHLESHLDCMSVCRQSTHELALTDTLSTAHSASL